MERSSASLFLCLCLFARVVSFSVFSQAQPASKANNTADAQHSEVKNGIDVLEERNFEVLHPNPETPKKIGLVTNQTGVDARGRRTIDVLANVPGVKLVALFSPEHGAIGALETTNIGNAVDQKTGIPIYSVFGATPESRRPPSRYCQNSGRGRL